MASDRLIARRGGDLVQLSPDQTMGFLSLLDNLRCGLMQAKIFSRPFRKCIGAASRSFPSKLIYTIGASLHLIHKGAVTWIEKDVVASIEAQEKCMMQYAPTVARRLRFPSCLIRTGRFIARSATRSIGRPERAIRSSSGMLFEAVPNYCQLRNDCTMQGKINP